MHKCLNCGTEFEGNFCPECGTHKNDGKNCRQCGKLLPKNAKFCTECGYSFLGELPAENARAEDEKTAAPAAREIAAASAPVQPAQPQQESYARAPLLNADLLRAAHGALRYIPAALLALFAVLALCFLATPLIGANLFLLGAKESAYEALSDTSVSFLHGSIRTVIVFASFAFLAAAVMGIAAHRNKWTALNYADFAAAPFYLAIFSAACALIGIINAEDGGAGVLTSETCPVLLIVFSLLFALFSAGATVGRYFLGKSPALAQAREELEIRRAALVPPDAPETVEKPKRSARSYLDPIRMKEPQIIKTANKSIYLKSYIFLEWILCLLLFMMPLIFLSPTPVIGFLPTTDWFHALIIFVTIFLIILYGTVCTYFYQTRFYRYNHVTDWNAKERSSNFYKITIIANLVIAAALWSWMFFRFPPTMIIISLLPFTLTPTWVSIFALRCIGKVNRSIYGEHKPKFFDAETAQIDFKEINRPYLEWLERQQKYEKFRVEEAIYRYEMRRYVQGEPYDKKPPRLYFSLMAKKISLAVGALVLAVFIAVPCIVYPIITNMFRISVVKKYTVGRAEYSVQNILPEPHQKSENTWKFYDDNCLALVRRMEENNNKLENVSDLEELGKIIQENEKLTQEMNKLTYRYMEIQFAKKDGDSEQLYVVRTMLDTRRCNSATTTVKAVDAVKLACNKFESHPDATNFSDTVEDVINYTSVEIFYKDGSFQSYYVPASAFFAVDFFKAGTYKLSWSDRWGEYAADFTVIGGWDTIPPAAQ